MLAYSAQDLILEPFAGAALGFTPGQSTQWPAPSTAACCSAWRGFTAGRGVAGRRASVPPRLADGGCLCCRRTAGPGRRGRGRPRGPFRPRLRARRRQRRLLDRGDRRHDEAGRRRPPAARGLRMGLWGAAQAVAFGLGGLVGTAASDLARALIGSPGLAYAAVFAAEAGVFVMAAVLAARVGREVSVRHDPREVGNAEVGSEVTRWMRSMRMWRFSMSWSWRRSGGRNRGQRPGTAGAIGAAARPRRPHQALRRRDSTAADPRFRDSRSLLVARARSARMVAPSRKKVDIPIENGFVGMVDRERFDEWLRERAAAGGAVRARRHLRAPHA